MEETTRTPKSVGQWVVNNPVPRPVLIFASLIILLMGIRAVLGASQPVNVARAISEGLMSVFHDDEGLKNMTLILTKDGRNNDGTVVLRDFGVGLGGILFGRAPRAGGNLSFSKYKHSSGVVLNGGALEVELSNADSKEPKTARYRVQGRVGVAGSDQPAYVQLDFISSGETYEVTQLSGNVTINGTTTPIEP